MTPVLVDTGPLVAAIDRRDRWSDWAVQTMGHCATPVLTCEAVVSESWFLLHRTSTGRNSLLKLLERDVLRIAFGLQDHVPRVAELMRRYSSAPMSLADASLVRMSEMQPESVVLTLDAGFLTYRRHRRQKIPLLMPEELQ